MHRRYTLMTLVLAVSACSPVLDWRESRPQGSAAQLLFPCKPELQTRAHMGLARCEAAGLEFSLSWAELPEPTQAGPALKQMRESLLSKLGGSAGVPQPFAAKGTTPQAESLTQTIGGERPARLAVFARGARVYQLLMSGPRADAAAWEAFAGSIQLLDAAP